jgi:transposase
VSQACFAEALKRGIRPSSEELHVHMPRRRKYPEELLERGVRLALESGRPVAQVARDLGIGSDLRCCASGCARPEADAGHRTDLLTSQEREEIRKLRKENYELRRANEILKSASLFFARELDTDRPR